MWGKQYYSANEVELESLSHKLNQAVQENSKLRSKLRVEMEEKYVLEQKVVSLTEKLVEAKRGLQDTSFALQKVQLVTSQLMSKKDEREMQLQEAQLQNNSLQRTVNELNRQLAEVMEQHAKEMDTALNRRDREVAATATVTNLSVPEKGDPDLENQLTTYREQISQLKRENFKLAEEKADAQYMIEAKNSRITVLEDRLRVAEAKMLLDWGASTPNRDSMSATGLPPGMQRPMSSSDFVAGGRNGHSLENKVIMLETDKSALEQRLTVLERQFSHPVIAAAAQLAPSIMSQVVEAQQQQIQGMASPPQPRLSIPSPAGRSRSISQPVAMSTGAETSRSQASAATTLRPSQSLQVPSPQMSRPSPRLSQSAASSESERSSSGQTIPMVSPIMTRSPSARSSSKLLKRNSLPPVIESDGATSTTTLQSEAATTMTTGAAAGEDIAQARYAAQAAVMASSSTGRLSSSASFPSHKHP